MNAPDATARAQDPNLHKAIASYLQTHTRAYDALVKFIKYRRQKQPLEDPLDDEERQLKYKCIRGIIKKQRKARGNEDWMVSNIQLAYLLRMDRSKLDDVSMACENKWFIPCQGRAILDSWGPITRHFFRPLEVGDMTGLEPSIKEPDTSIHPVQETIDPVQETVDLCSELDSRCVITGSPLTIVSLIVPFNFDGSDEDLEYTKSLAPALSAIIDNPNGEEPVEHLKTLYKHQGSTCQPWNATCINRDLQQLWTSGLCALKWLNAVALPEDASKSRIRLQFNWLYPKDSIRMPDVTLQDDKETREDIYPSEDFHISARDHESGRQIESGDVCTVIRFTEDIDKCKQMFDIQWAITNAACESGFTAEVDLDEEVEWDLDAEEFPGEDDEWEMSDGSECS